MSEQQPKPGIAPARLSADEYARNFSDSHAPLTHNQALIESDRCYFCFDAPCVQACPTAIDIPSFIRKIATGNLQGAAHDILKQNSMGAVCARVCPTEVLCEGACVRNHQDGKPVTIGALQRHATDFVFDRNVQLFSRGQDTGKHVAVVGGGPAGLSCAHRLAMLGHRVTVFEARDKLGGLNEYGVAAYKVTNAIAQREVDYLLEIGGIDVRLKQRLGPDIDLAQLRAGHDAVFLGVGLSGVNSLGIDEPAVTGVLDAVAYIERLRQARDLSALPVGRRIVVIGGGMTAIDIACQTRKLGAEEVTIVYRRGPEAMGASEKEREWAQVNGVAVRHWAQPMRVISTSGALSAVRFQHTRMESGKLIGTGETFELAADMLFKAIGQVFVGEGMEILETNAGRIAVDEEGRTSLAGVWAGGDCVAGGKDLTVVAVEHGKRAARSIDRALRVQSAGMHHG
jgi:glutamate synthase (NADPH/NADH) small chain